MLRLTRHAADRMQERSVTSQEVQSVISAPDVTFPDRKGNHCCVRTIDGRRIKVVVDQADHRKVITVIVLDD